MIVKPIAHLTGLSCLFGETRYSGADGGSGRSVAELAHRPDTRSPTQYRALLSFAPRHRALPLDWYIGQRGFQFVAHRRGPSCRVERCAQDRYRVLHFFALVVQLVLIS
jgi:hypothetical protein